MKTLITFFFLCSVSSNAFAAHVTCAEKVLAQAGLIEATSEDFLRTNDESQPEGASDREITEAEQKQSAAAFEILTAVHNLQLAPNDPPAPIITQLCKNNLSVHKTIAQ